MNVLTSYEEHLIKHQGLKEQNQERNSMRTPWHLDLGSCSNKQERMTT